MKILGVVTNTIGRRIVMGLVPVDRWVAFALAILAGFLPVGVSAYEAIPGEVLQQLTQSAVYIRADRVFDQRRFPTAGSGFFVHPEGYILTNWHVIADQIGGEVWGQEREFNTKVLKLTAVVDSGLPEERELPARVIARDRRYDLALLKVNYRPATILDINRVDDVAVGSSIWVAGFPFGSMLALDRKTEHNTAPNPAVTISRGMVTSLRRNVEGKVTMVQTDAALNPGNSGGPVVNVDGRLVGVVFSMIHGGQALGFAVSPNRVREFLARNAVRIEFEPAMVLSPPQPILVTVEPLLLDFGADSGEVLFEGDDIAEVSVELVPGGNGLQGVIQFPERITGRNQPQKYLATVILDSKLSNEPIRRRYRLDAVPESFATVGSQRDPARMMEDRKVFGNEMKLEDLLDDEEVAEQPDPNKKRGLSDFAGSTKLQTDAEGNVVLDNRAVSEIGGKLLDQSRYELIEDPALRQKVVQFDRVLATIYAQDKSRKEAAQGHSWESWEYAYELGESLSELRTKRYELGKYLTKKRVVWCEDEQQYIVKPSGRRDEAPCRYNTLRY